MDIHLIPGASPGPDERDAVDAVLGAPETRWNGAVEQAPDERFAGGSGRDSRPPRTLLLPALNALHARVGFITPGALNYVCQRLGLPPAEAYGVATFYHLFSTEPRPPAVAYVCDDIACRVNGARELCADLAARLGPPGTPVLDGAASWKPSPCLGQCERGPAVLLQQAGAAASERVIIRARAGDVVDDLRLFSPAPCSPSTPAGASTPQADQSDRAGLRLLSAVGRIDPGSLDEYRASGGYAVLRRALAIGSGDVLREVNDSRLRGRGGAAFPTARKWEDVARAPARPHYVVCNADESEPGTFKDRVLMEENPFALIEALTIAGFATGSDLGYIYIRGEYPLAAARLQHAVDQARLRGFLGADVMGEGVSFEIEIRRGAGAYICGEETALFNSIEGLRGEPRNKPPFPTQHGLFGKPTVVNNVETLLNLLHIVGEGAASFARAGTDQSSGTKLFCLSGCVARPGVFEVPFGTTLRELLTLAGGVREGRSLQTVLLGGAAGSFLTPDEIDVPLSFEGTRAIGASLGSGVVMVFDDSVDMTDIVVRIAAFFRDESCGQCVPCRVGTERVEEAVGRLAAGRPLGSFDDEVILLREVDQAMRDASICGLGQTAAIAVQSAVTKLRLFDGGRR